MGKSNTFYLFIFYFLFSISIIYADRRGFLADLHRFAQGVTTPVGSQLFRARVALFAPFSGFSSENEKDKKIREMEAENAGLLAKLASLKGVEEENVRARHLLGATLPPSWHFEPARVVSVFADKMFLTSDTVPSLGMPVITSGDKGGVFLGLVENVSGKKATVVLPTSESAKNTVLIRDGETGERHGAGILVGQGRLTLEQVLASETINEGDIVVTSGEGLPPELLVGYVTKVLEIKGAFQEAEVEPAVDPAKLDFVFLITRF
ncbi:MAG: rod shape-determining protein MreC [Candidatus Blackburnbacteria bacterium]|nr:rod shape-determining protein MreC [Candidatus Blackburnbacteria bacterium]